MLYERSRTAVKEKKLFDELNKLMEGAAATTRILKRYKESCIEKLRNKNIELLRNSSTEAIA